MSEIDQRLSHAQSDCHYPVGVVSKRRRPELFGHLRPPLGPSFRELARHKECTSIEGH